MDAYAEQCRLLGDFLRARREAMPPASPGRRRTPGLRREEVADASGISTTWYTWLEQGREISLSVTALSRLAAVLQLSAAERGYLFELARKRDPAPAPPEPVTASAPEELLALLHEINAPAYLLDGIYTAKGWNKAAQDLFQPWHESGEPNLLRFVFLHQDAKNFIADWEARARRLAAEFRAETASAPEMPERRALIADLRQESQDFARFWTSHVVQAREGGARVFIHPIRGMLRYTQSTLTPASYTEYKLVALLPATGIVSDNTRGPA
ncbi:helix-turn-helix transcriptional regulator [Acidocella sp.]|jgi:transcriptional regulator with XRE-family HTH domain|uniref:helix-turn-helix transcriptional regulator n=1 Tax=Acidocella sp. TaxID=50710 RepID=UPI002F4036EB